MLDRINSNINVVIINSIPIYLAIYELNLLKISINLKD